MVSGAGREHAGASVARQGACDDLRAAREPLPSDGSALRRYCERYEYDPVGNILTLIHEAAAGGWSRHYTYDDVNAGARTDRLTGTRIGHAVNAYAYDACGNTTRMPHLSSIGWDFKDQLRYTRRQSMKSEEGGTTYYVYNSKGERVRKVLERPSGSPQHERLFVGAFETYLKY